MDNCKSFVLVNFTLNFIIFFMRVTSVFGLLIIGVDYDSLRRTLDFLFEQNL